MASIFQKSSKKTYFSKNFYSLRMNKKYCVTFRDLLSATTFEQNKCDPYSTKTIGSARALWRALQKHITKKSQYTQND